VIQTVPADLSPSPSLLFSSNFFGPFNPRDLLILCDLSRGVACRQGFCIFLCLPKALYTLLTFTRTLSLTHSLTHSLAMKKKLVACTERNCVERRQMCPPACACGVSVGPLSVISVSDINFLSHVLQPPYLPLRAPSRPCRNKERKALSVSVRDLRGWLYGDCVREGSRTDR